MTRKSNGGIVGKKSADNVGIRALYNKPRDNGGIIGPKIVSSDLQQNIGKTSGFWNATNFKIEVNGAYVDTPYSYQETYWVYPSAYQEFVETSRYTVASGTWNPDPGGCPDEPTWCCGYPWNYGSDWSWTYIGCPWYWESYQVNGYYQWVYPSPYQDTRTVSGTNRTYYNVWTYF